MRLQNLEMVRETNSLENKFGPMHSRYGGAKAERNNEKQNVSALCLPPCRTHSCRRGRNDTVWFGNHPLSDPPSQPRSAARPRANCRGCHGGLVLLSLQEKAGLGHCRSRSLHPPGPRPVPGYPRAAGTPWAVLPSQKRITPIAWVRHPPNLPGTGASPGHRPKVRRCGAPRDSRSGAVCPPFHPHQRPQAGCSLLGCPCWCARAGHGSGDPRGSDTAPLPGRFHRGAFSHPQIPVSRTATPARSAQTPKRRPHPLSPCSAGIERRTLQTLGREKYPPKNLPFGSAAPLPSTRSTCENVSRVSTGLCPALNRFGLKSAEVPANPGGLNRLFYTAKPLSRLCPNNVARSTLPIPAEKGEREGKQSLMITSSNLILNSRAIPISPNKQTSTLFFLMHMYLR